LALDLAWAVKKLVLQQFSLAQLLFQSTVAAKHNNPQDKPVVLPESRSLVLRIVQVFWLHTAGLRNKTEPTKCCVNPEFLTAQAYGNHPTK